MCTLWMYILNGKALWRLCGSVISKCHGILPEKFPNWTTGFHETLELYKAMRGLRPRILFTTELIYFFNLSATGVVFGCDIPYHMSVCR